MTCRERAGQVRKRRDELIAAGANVVAIGTGSKRYARAFIADESFPFPVLLDSDAAAAGIVETNTLRLGALVRPAQLLAGTRSLLGGNRQRKTGVRPRQLGATVVIAPDGRIIYESREDYAGDHADIDEILTAIASA